jgi:tetratricopeptide (TPR) repeat protein
MQLFDRDRIWGLAWALVPIALVLNLFVGSAYETSMRLAYQGGTDAAAGQWTMALERYEAAAAAAPGSAPMAHNVAVAYRQLGNAPAALQWNDEALRRDPAFEPALKARPTLERAARRAQRGAKRRDPLAEPATRPVSGGDVNSS